MNSTNSRGQMKQKGGSVQSTTVSPLGQWGMPRGQQNKMGVGSPQRKHRRPVMGGAEQSTATVSPLGLLGIPCKTKEGLKFQYVSSAVGQWGTPQSTTYHVCDKKWGTQCPQHKRCHRAMGDATKTVSPLGQWGTCHELRKWRT